VSKPLNPKAMIEATRLVRTGRLAESTALLQHLIRRARAPDGDDAAYSAGRQPPMIDGEFRTIEGPDTTEAGAPEAISTEAAGKAQPILHGLRGLLDRIKGRAGPGAHGLFQRRPISAPEIVPAGGQFIESMYSNAAGTRTYKLYVPSGYRGQAVPLVVMLHGCTQSPDDFAAGTRMNMIAEEKTCLVAYPAQASDANPAKCWNWFRPADQRRGEGEPSLIAGITRQVMSQYAVDPRRVYIGGLSAGAAAAAVMGATYPDIYAAIGVHSGLACGAAADMPSAFAAMRNGESSAASTYRGAAAVPEGGPSIPTIVFHGDCDTTVHPRNGHHVIAQSKRTTSARMQVHRGRITGGHAYTRTLHIDASGRVLLEHWEIHGAGHAWSGGSPAGSYTDPRGPDATREMLRFFLDHQTTGSNTQ
jgi:poly(hydroxyalkanoate) depolymerase family esterase